MSCLTLACLGHWIKTLVLGIGANAFDVWTDGTNGKTFLEGRLVNRTFEENITVPASCFQVANSSLQYQCQEEDTVWGVLTLGCIQLPALVLAVCAGIAIMLFEGCSKKLFFLAVLVIVPFPITVLVQQVWSLFVVSAQMEMMSAIFLFGEGALEASPQLVLQNYIILSDAEREVLTIQMLAIVSAYFTIAKTSIEMYSAESGGWYSPSDLINHEDTHDDSIMKNKSFFVKLLTMAQISPAFLSSLVFRVGSLSIVCTLLKGYSAIYISVGIVIAFVTAYNTVINVRSSTDERVGDSLFYCFTNVTIMSKCPHHSRKENYPPMFAVSVAWLAYHSLALISLMVWYALLPHPAHWAATRLADPSIFYHVCGSLLAIGPISILALWGLKWQVKAMAEDLWDP